MNCSICGAANPENAMFCSNCGGKFEATTFLDIPLADSPVTQDYVAPQEQPLVYDAVQPPVYNEQPPAYSGETQPAYNAQQPPTYSSGYNVYENTGGAPYGGYTNLPATRGNASQNWAAIMGLIFGILTIPCCSVLGITFELFRVSYFATLVFIAPALIFSIIGLRSQKKGLAIAGLICSLVGLLLAILMGGALISQLQDPNSDVYNLFYEFYQTAY